MLSTWRTATTESIPNILCYYSNDTSQIQLIQLTDEKNASWKKIIFPRQKILFEGIPEAQLEIYTGRSGNPKCIELISCQSLQVNQVQTKRTAVKNILLSEEKPA